ncbi:multidrug transporter AcrB (plasmid) [Pseudomonas frederiksbergensis]|uniref:Multidrug transporter AcrB n=1 Tax=Pseudomonas frederiksbergensis TaxID=104087 RepID=A0A1J0EUE8_9PSED|nr:efflux RND transporter permease subunit [Pseudomonas frederiksbergensis]APC19587.1 multidrug transporter AcrB [Pseudomonas frederiksbergensis]
MNLADFTLRRATSAWLVVALVLCGGYWAYQQLGRFEDPEFIIRQAAILTSYPGASPSEVADEITDRIEGAAQQLPEIEKITSVSRAGESLVKVEVRLSNAGSQADLEQVWGKLRGKMDEVAPSLPPGASRPLVKGDFGDVFALFYAVHGKDYSARQLNDYADRMRRELVLVPGVAKVALLGEPREAIFVEVVRERAARLGVELEQIHASLALHNQVLPAGNVRAGAMRLEVRPLANSTSLDSLRALIVAGDSSRGLVRLSDIADVRRNYLEPPTVLMRRNGEPAIGIGITNVTGGNVVQLGEAVQQRLQELEGIHPIGIQLENISLQSDSVRVAVQGFVINLIAAVAIVVVVLLLFLGLRSGLIIGVVLVLTVAGTLMAMYAHGIAMQRISLGALIIALGMLVDNAIVVTDSILVRLQRGEQPVNAARAVVKATAWPLLGGTTVGILAFSAIGLSPTDMGEYAGSLFWVILYSMLLSWLFALTLTPLFCVHFLKQERQPDSPAPGRLLRGYLSLLHLALRHRSRSVALLVTLLAAGVIAFSQVPPGFMPDSARPQFVVDIYLPQGTDIRRTAERVAVAAQRVSAEQDVSAITSFIGQGGLRFMLTYSPEDPNPAYGQLLVDVTDYHQIADLIARLQPALSDLLPEADIKVWKFMLGRGGGKKIEATFRGPDAIVLRQLAEQAKAIMAEDPQALAIQDDWRQPVPVVSPRYDMAAAQRAGVTPAELNAALNRTLSGTTVGVFREREKLLPIIARAPEAERGGVEDLRTVLVFAPTAARFVPIEQFIERLDTRWQDALIRRENRFPMIKAQCDPPAGELSAPLFERLRPKIEQIPLPAGYQLEWHGEYKAAKEANAGLALAAPFGFLAMVVAVILMFNALRQTAVIWLTVPLAVLGVAIGLLLFQAPFEFMAILGFLSLTGMLIKNAIVLVDQIDAEIAAGRAGYAALLEAATSRVRPVLLGALTTVLGVAPLLADPFFHSMAVTVMFGLVFATGLTLLVVPLLYAILLRIPNPVSQQLEPGYD